jgi:antibiotic biosynthesis monooxygenase (ABM) superfamily enzyme
MAQSKNFSNEPVTAVFSWTVKQGKEQLFEHMMHDMHKVARTFPGHMGVTTLRSPGHKGNFQTVLRFDNAKHLEAWLSSPIRQKMMKPLEEIVHTDTSAKATGLETWFEIPGQLVTPPPRWKMVVTAFIAIYPLSLLSALYVTPHIVNLPVLVRALFLPVFAPIILTYLFMPFLTRRVLKRWLYKSVPS